MHPAIKNFLAILAGLVIGSIINQALLMLGNYFIQLPEGSTIETMEGLIAAMERLTPKHFISPFLAHALGTLSGAFVAIKIANRLSNALIVGAFFLLGGIYMVMSLPSPPWFNILDLSLAYIPMAWIAFKVSNK